MQLGLHIPSFTWPGGPQTLNSDLARTASAAEEAGFGYVSVMDHFWQIGVVGPPEQEMLEAYTTLGFLAAHTSRVRLQTLVTGVTYRPPGLLAKTVTTLDVLSGGRAGLGIGAAWHEEEARGLGLPFAPTAERFERLEETLRICRRMWSEDEEPFQGTHYRLDRPLNSPQPLTRPHPPIMVGGGGERKTLRLVARYAQACNLFAGPELAHKLEVLRGHCEAEGRDYDEIEKTATMPFEIGPDGEGVDELLKQLRDIADLGVTTVFGWVHDAADGRRLEVLGREVIPIIAQW
ncbi:LLM class F420-dependent oxidoreductase [Salinactinospora qingdaonensis]|uniref:LLM class F420-dependent oxidoreductase n=1 Tax=Salinactinospora qingdaonensis TaxID=702744 RepID=A0ABP7FWC1_9ACTN